MELQTNETIAEGHRSIVTPQGIAIVIGGNHNLNYTNKVFKVEDSYQGYTLKELEPMRTSRAFFGITYFDDIIYVAGGISGETDKWFKPTNQVEKYIVSRNRWEKCSPLPELASHFSMAPLGSGKIIKLGGFTDSQVFLNKIDVYSIFTDQWTSLQNDNRFILSIDPGITPVSN